MRLGFILELQPAPVEGGKLAEQLAQFEMLAGHRERLWHEFFADIFGDGFTSDLGGEMVAALRRGFMDRADEEIQMRSNLRL